MSQEDRKERDSQGHSLDELLPDGGLVSRELSSRSQVSGRASFIRFPALLESQGPGRWLLEKACRLEGYLKQTKKNIISKESEK